MGREKEVPRTRRALGLLVALVIVGCGREAPPPTRPNIVLISIDTLRADALSAYGCEHPTSPNLDALVARGVLFEDATSTSSWTLPAHLSMLTGLTQSAHGICDERLWDALGQPGGPTTLPLRGVFLPELLLSSGYVTGGFYSWQYLSPAYGFGPGFETWRRVGATVWAEGPLRERYLALQAAGDSAAIDAWRAAEPTAFDEQAPTADRVVDAGIEWIDDQASRPFFLFLHLFDAHDDYVAPPPFRGRFDADYHGPIDGTKVSAPDSLIRGDLPPEDLFHLEALYHEEVAWVDAQLGRFFEALEARGLTENTLIVVTSDHGEEFFEHGHKTHRTQLFAESTDVPLIFAWPGHLPAGRRISGPVGIVDIAPTIAALAGAAPASSTSGRDLTAILRGEEPNPEVTYLSELMLFKRGSPTPERHTALRRGKDHWLRIVDRTGHARGIYFDRDKNPKEAGPGQAFVEGSPEMARFDELLAPVRRATRRERDAAPSRADLFSTEAPRDSEELASMGYVGGDAGVEMKDSTRLCLDGCFSLVPSSTNSQ